MSDSDLTHPCRFDELIHEESIASRLEERRRIIQRLLDLLTDRGVALDRFFDRLAIDEVVTNAIVHGNHQDPEKHVSVKLFFREGRWGLEVLDEGSGFDFERLRSRLHQIPDTEKPSGRGLPLVQASGFEITFLDGGRRIVIVKERGGSSSPGRQENS